MARPETNQQRGFFDVRRKTEEKPSVNLKGDSQIIVLVPLGIKCVPHSVCRVALSRTIHNYFGKGIWEA